MNWSPQEKSYLGAGAGLLGLLALTIAAAYVDLGPMNSVVALAISLAKGGLIVWIFMHIRRGSPSVWIAAAAGFFWLGIMIVLTLSDFLTRHWQ